MNRTVTETAHGPKVAWETWSPEAFARARREDKLVLLDIGAAWCHWCHVMDRTTYDDDEVADFVNRNFVPIRVDRDRRPDLDRRYQNAPALAESHGNGWPLTAFLLPGGAVLARATYLPPKDKDGAGGFLTLAESVLKIYHERRPEVEAAEAEAREQLAATMAPDLAGPLSADLLHEVVRGIEHSYDESWGGFTGAPHRPKFPAAGACEFLMAYAFRTGNQRALEMVATTLTRMAQGGLQDHLGGGFHRYSVDRFWRVPHFEKLLYDNAELLSVYLQAWQATGDDYYREVSEGLVRFTDEVLSDPAGGGFFGSQDADVGLSDDGDYFTWSLAEAEQVLAGDELEVFSAHYDLQRTGEMPHDPSRNVLFAAMNVEGLGRLMNLPEDEVRPLLARAKQRALEARQKRPAPAVDRTLYVSWNGMMIRAYVLASQTLARPELLATARRAADRMLRDARRDDGAFNHVAAPLATATDAGAGPAAPESVPATGLLEDQAWMALALVDLYAATAEPAYLTAAQLAVRWADEHLWDEAAGGYFADDGRPDHRLVAAGPPAADRAEVGQVGRAAESPGLPPDAALAPPDKPIDDNPSSSANAVMVLALLRLAAVTESQADEAGRPGESGGLAARYLERGRQTVEAFAGVFSQFGAHAGAMANAAELHLQGPTRVQVVSRQATEAADLLLRAAHSVYVPGKIVMALDQSQPAGAALIRRAGYAVGEAAVGYVCHGRRHLPPVETPFDMVRVLEEKGHDRTADGGGGNK